MSDNTETTTYTQTIDFQNDWGNNLKGVWIAYVSGSQDPVYFDCFETIDEGSTIKVGTINPRSGKSDYWTVTILDQYNKLWGTKVEVKSNLPNDDETIQIEAEQTSSEIQIISSKGTSTLSLTRL